MDLLGPEGMIDEVDYKLRTSRTYWELFNVPGANGKYIKIAFESDSI